MKKLALIVALFAFFIMPANALTVTQKEMGYISVNTTASKEMTPDTATISFSVETRAKDSKTASEKNKEITSKMISSLKPLLELDKKDTIQTKNLNLRTEYSYDKGKRTLIGYVMVNTVTVKTKNLSIVSKLIDTAVENKATDISELRFYVENENDCVGKLVEEATANAKVLAQRTAETLGQKISGVKNISMNWGPSYESYDNVRLYNSAKAAAGSNVKSTPVESGKVKIQANVHAQFYVK